jgi:tryptophan synthase beta subunit
MVEAAGLPETSIIIVNLSGRGDKDLGIVSRCQCETPAGKDMLS